MAELTVVGTGIQIGRDLTDAARYFIKAADKVFYVAGDPIAAGIIEDLNPSAESLHTLYSVEKPRLQTYHEMSERILDALRSGKNVCVASYGHPGVFAYPMHRAIERARREGHRASMLPAVSSVDCLFADLGIDPAENGVQIYDATYFLRRQRRYDVSSALILLQIGVVGEACYPAQAPARGVRLLAERLTSIYGADHELVVYAAAQYVWGNPSIQRVTASTLAEARLDLGSTLFVPAKNGAAPDKQTARRLERRAHARKNS